MLRSGDRRRKIAESFEAAALILGTLPYGEIGNDCEKRGQDRKTELAKFGWTIKDYYEPGAPNYWNRLEVQMNISPWHNRIVKRTDENPPDPYTEPEWVLNPEDAACFDTRGRTEPATVRVAGASGSIYDDQQEFWYVVRV